MPLRAKKKRRWLAALFFVRTTTKLFRVCGWGGAKFAASNGAHGTRGHGRHSCRGSVALHEHGYHGAFGLFDKRQGAFRSHIDADEVSQPDLAGSDQIGQRKYQMPFNRTLQVPRSVFRIRALLQQETLHLGSAVEYK